ncbi:MAG TPA: hypothetical protein VIV12_13385 [Streptosporangiaceae bacterium]
MKLLSQIWKAIAGAVFAAGGAYATALSDGVITDPEKGWIVGAAIMAALGVFFAPKNKPAVPPPHGYRAKTPDLRREE